jgi:hypothetical protein
MLTLKEKQMLVNFASLVIAKTISAETASCRSFPVQLTISTCVSLV